MATDQTPLMLSGFFLLFMFIIFYFLISQPRVRIVQSPQPEVVLVDVPDRTYWPASQSHWWGGWKGWGSRHGPITRNWSPHNIGPSTWRYYKPGPSGGPTTPPTVHPPAPPTPAPAPPAPAVTPAPAPPSTA